MKRFAIAMMLGVAALSASAQVNYQMQTACNPKDVKGYDTDRLRSEFVMEKVMAIIRCLANYDAARQVYRVAAAIHRFRHHFQPFHVRARLLVICSAACILRCFRLVNLPVNLCKLGLNF